jgi:predicted nucleic acid-binding protein
MILLDTNVVSELMKPRPEPAVLDWLDKQDEGTIFISAITRAEIELGIALLPEGKRREGLATAANAMFVEDFAGVILPFDRESAIHYAILVAHRTRIGRPITTEDAQIAAIALQHRLTLVTRNIKDFEEIINLNLINPWQTV